MKKFYSALLLIAMLSCTLPSLADTHGVNGKVTPKSIAAGAASLIIWPGLGQLVNDQPSEKVLVHALLGLTVVFRFWSCYDGVVDRDGGVWDNRI